MGWLESTSLKVPGLYWKYINLAAIWSFLSRFSIFLIKLDGHRFLYLGISKNRGVSPKMMKIMENPIF